MPTSSFVKNNTNGDATYLPDEALMRDPGRLGIVCVSRAAHGNNTDLSIGDEALAEFSDGAALLVFERPDGSLFVQRATREHLRQESGRNRVVGMVVGEPAQPEGTPQAALPEPGRPRRAPVVAEVQP